MIGSTKLAITWWTPKNDNRDGLASKGPMRERLSRTVHGIIQECVEGLGWVGGPRAYVRYVCDVFLYRVLRFLPLKGAERFRAIRLRGGGMIVYRLDRGDIRALAETFGISAYAIEPVTKVRTLVDLGANIGLVSVWLARHLDVERVIAVEASAANAHLARANLALNGIDGVVMHAAVGARDGSVTFQTDPRNSTVGTVLPSSGLGNRTTVTQVSMQTVLSQLPPGVPVDVLKLDIEGAEAELISGDLTWLDRVELIIAELHPNLVDVEPVIKAVCDRGFSYRELAVHDDHWLFGDVMAVFERTRGALSTPTAADFDRSTT